jgi:hypothetical protein
MGEWSMDCFFLLSDLQGYLTGIFSTLGTRRNFKGPPGELCSFLVVPSFFIYVPGVQKIRFVSQSELNNTYA